MLINLKRGAVLEYLDSRAEEIESWLANNADHQRHHPGDSPWVESREGLVDEMRRLRDARVIIAEYGPEFVEVEIEMGAEPDGAVEALRKWIDWAEDIIASRAGIHPPSPRQGQGGTLLAAAQAERASERVIELEEGQVLATSNERGVTVHYKGPCRIAVRRLADDAPEENDATK
jgi:hypothetical protein